MYNKYLPSTGRSSVKWRRDGNEKKCNIASSVYRHGMEVRTTQHQVSLGTAWNILQRNIMLMETVWTGGFYSVASSVSAHGMDDFSAWHHM